MASMVVAPGVCDEGPDHLTKFLFTQCERRGRVMLFGFGPYGCANSWWLCVSEPGHYLSLSPFGADDAYLAWDSRG